MGWGSSQTTTSNQQQNQSTVNGSMPVQQPWVASMQQGMAPQYAQLIQQANAPVYGDAQKASYMENLNDLANSATKNLSSTLASHGQLNSGEFGKEAAGIQQQKVAQESSFFSQLPAAERQAHMSNMLQALGASNGFLSSVPVGQLSTGTSSGDSSGSQTTQTNPGLSGLVGGLMGMALSGVTGGLSGGIASAVGGGSFGQGYQNAIQPAQNPFSMQPMQPRMGSQSPSQWQGTQPVNGYRQY